MTQLTFGYSDSEDRIWLRFSDDGAQLWLTRRLASGCLRHLVELMSASCPGSEGIGHSLAAEQRLALEHETAQEWKSEQAAVTQTPPPMKAVQASHRLSAVRLTVQAHEVRMEYVAPDYSRSTQMTRAQAHDLLSALARRCEAAGWNLAGLPSWLGAGSMP